MSGNYTDAQKAATLKSMRSFFLAAIEEKIQNDMN